MRSLRWPRRAVGMGALATTVLALSAVARCGLPPETPPPTPAGSPVEEVASAEERYCANEAPVRDWIEGGMRNQSSVMVAAAKALADHESKCDPVAISRTGAAGLFQLTVPTASGRGVRPLHAPPRFFVTDRQGRLQFRSLVPEFREAYGESLRDAAADSRDDYARAASIDARFDPIVNTRAFLTEFTDNHRRVSAYVDVPEQAARIAFIAHNLGITAVENRYLRNGVRTSEALLERMQRDTRITEDKKVEVRNFFSEVSRRFAVYNTGSEISRSAGPCADLDSLNSQGRAVFQCTVDQGDTKYGIARRFNSWDSANGDRYGEVRPAGFVDENGAPIPDLLRPTQRVYITAERNR